MSYESTPLFFVITRWDYIMSNRYKVTLTWALRLQHPSSTIYLLAMMKKLAVYYILLDSGVSLLQSTIAFCPHVTTLTGRRLAATTMPQSLSMINLHQVDEAVTAAAAPASSSSSIMISDALDILQNAVLVVGILVALAVGAALFFDQFVMPQAAEELELQAKRDYPDLWEKFALASLQPGEELKERPDVIEALGTAMIQRQQAEYDAAQAKIEQTKKQTDGMLDDSHVTKDDKEK